MHSTGGTGGIRGGSGVGLLILNPAFAQTFSEAGLANPADFLSAGRVRRRVGPKENAVLTIRREGGTATFFLKRHFGPRSRQGLVEWQRTAAAAQAGVPVAEAAAAGSCRSGSFFCSAGIEGAEPLDDLLASGSLSPAERKRLIIEAAAVSAALHAAGWFHRDLYLCHFMASAGSAGAGPALRLIDLERLTRPRILRHRWMVKDLAAMHYSSKAARASQADRARFLRAYAAAAGLNPGRAAFLKLAAEVTAKSGRIEAHEMRRKKR